MISFHSFDFAYFVSSFAFSLTWFITFTLFALFFAHSSLHRLIPPHFAIPLHAQSLELHFFVGSSHGSSYFAFAPFVWFTVLSHLYAVLYLCGVSFHSHSSFHFLTFLLCVELVVSIHRPEFYVLTRLFPGVCVMQIHKLLCYIESTPLSSAFLSLFWFVLRWCMAFARRRRAHWRWIKSFNGD